jgi:hypothetical protein
MLSTRGKGNQALNYFGDRTSQLDQSQGRRQQFGLRPHLKRKRVAHSSKFKKIENKQAKI